MSPIIYTPHYCETPEEDLRSGTLWQCEVCETIWEARRPRIGDWVKIAVPRRERIVTDALNRPALTSETTTPTVTPDMVHLVLDTYAEHEDFVTRDGREFCAECDAPLTTGPLVLVAHASRMAAAVLQDALRGETHE